MRNIKVLGIDLAKNVFQIHGTDSKGKCVLRKRLSRAQLMDFLPSLPQCVIGIEASCGSHYWSRLFKQMGHLPKIMSPQFVKPYIKSNKNDRNDARGIAEAVTRPDMKFVPTKSIEQQDILLLHRARALVIKQRTAQANQIRGLLADYGIIISKGISHVKKLVTILDENKEHLTTNALAIFMQLYEQFKAFSAQLIDYDKRIESITKQDVNCKAIMEIEGIGPLTASAIIATIGNANEFKNGREVSAWLGLVPKQYSSGNTIRLSGISKRGDCYVRTLLIQGARTALKYCDNKTDAKSLWMKELKDRCGYNKAAVALANKNARMIWAMLCSGESYRFSTKQA